MKIFVYKGLTRNPEIGNTSISIFSNLWRLGQVRDNKFDKNVSNKMLLNAVISRLTAFIISELLKENQQGGGEGWRGGGGYY